MADGSIGDDLVWLWQDHYYEYVSDWEVPDVGALPYVSVSALEEVLKVLDGA